MQRFDPQSCAVAIIDVQDKLVAAMPADGMADLLRSAAILLEACDALGAHAIVTEQYPRGLGPTVAAIKDRIGARQPVLANPIAKTRFSACGSEEFIAALDATRAQAVVVIGMEAHVCVVQTVRDLIGRGLSVLVPVDGAISRRADHRAIGLDLCKAAGATLTTTETLVFDWLGDAQHPEFKRMSRLIR